MKLRWVYRNIKVATSDLVETYQKIKILEYSIQQFHGIDVWKEVPTIEGITKKQSAKDFNKSRGVLE